MVRLGIRSGKSYRHTALNFFNPLCQTLGVFHQSFRLTALVYSETSTFQRFEDTTNQVPEILHASLMMLISHGERVLGLSIFVARPSQPFSVRFRHTRNSVHPMGITRWRILYNLNYSSFTMLSTWLLRQESQIILAHLAQACHVSFQIYVLRCCKDWRGNIDAVAGAWQ